MTEVVGTPRLELRSLAKSFGAVRAVRGVSLAIAPGEIHGLCGHNGAGKSTLINMLAGNVAADAGEILVDGEPLSFAGPRDAQRAGIATVDQELSLVPTLSVAENFVLGQVGAGLLRHARRAGGPRSCWPRSASRTSIPTPRSTSSRSAPASWSRSRGRSAVRPGC